MPVSPGTKPLKKLSKGMGLYQVFYRPKQGPKGKPYCIVNLQTGDINGRWHATKESARQQQKALYFKLGNKARFGMGEIANVVKPVQFAEFKDDLLWIEALEAKPYHTTAYGEVVVTNDKLENFVANFKGNVRGQEVATDYEHG